MASNASWGIEVGATALKAVKLVRDGDSVAVADFVIIPHKKPLSAPEIDEKEARRVALGTLVAQHDLNKAGIAVSVPGSQSFARFPNELPATEPKQLPALVEYEAKMQIPFPLTDVQWDYQIFATPDSPMVSVGIFAIRTETVMDQLAKWQDVGRVPDIVTLNPLAVYNALAWDQGFNESTPGTVILDIGTTSTDLIIADGPKLWVRTFPVGGHQFTEALVTALNTSYMKAEKLKGEAETSQHARHILQALRPVFGDLAQDVQRSIGYYTSQPQNRSAKLTRVICLGSTFRLPGLKKFLSQQLQMDVQMLEGFARISKVQGGDQKLKLFQENAFQLAAATGLALQGLQMQTLSANLVPMSVVKESMWRGKTPWFAAAAGVALAAGAATFWQPLMNSSAVSAADKPAVIDEVKRQLGGLKGQWGEAEAAYQPDAKAPVLTQLVDQRSVMPKVLDDLGALMAHASGKLPALAGPQPATIEFGDFASTYVPAGPEGGGVADPNNPPVAGGKGTLRNALLVRVSRRSSEAESFVENELQNWLKANSKRSGIYEITKANWKLVGRDLTVGDDGNPGNWPPLPVVGGGPGGPGRPGGGGGGGGGFPGRLPGPGGPGGPGGMGGPIIGPGGFGGLPVGPGGGRVPGGAGGDERGGRPPIGPSGPGARPVGTDEDANRLAPLPRISGYEPGTTVSTFLIEWEAAFVTDQPKQEGQQ
jgi:type IV pilus assembly protein PilM